MQNVNKMIHSIFFLPWFRGDGVCSGTPFFELRAALFGSTQIYLGPKHLVRSHILGTTANSADTSDWLRFMPRYVYDVYYDMRMKKSLCHATILILTAMEFLFLVMGEMERVMEWSRGLPVMDWTALWLCLPWKKCEKNLSYF